MRYRVRRLGSLGDDSTDSSDTGPSLISQLVTGYEQYKLSQQQLNTANQLVQENIQRARQGLPPLNVDLGLTAPTVNVGLSAGIQQILTYGLIGFGGLFALNMLMKKAR